VLELGCGPALFWVENLARVPAGWDVTLTDLSPGMCETAQRNLGAAADRFTFEVVDAQSIPYAVAAFDAVIANHMLYHVPDRPRAFAEIRRVLRPGGRFYATTIGEANLRELDEWNRHVGLGAAIMANRDVAALFGLESGAVQLAPWFSEIRRDMYDDGLAITETPLLKAYVRSALDGAQAAAYADALTAFDRFVDEELARCGILGITKSAGLFQAVR
jgi:SAM-dependent methyltransferase